METNDSQGKIIQSTQTAFDIIEYIAERDRPSITEIAAEVDCSRSTVHYHLETLRRNRYVVRDENELRLGLRMARLGHVSLQKHQLSGVVETVADELATETDAVAHIGVKEENELVWMYRSMDGASDDIPTDVGKATRIHSTAYGQAILAYASEETVRQVVHESALPSVTEQTLTTPAELEERLATVRKLGFAYSAEECCDGISSIAAPIFDESDAAVGAIGITAPQSRIDNPYKHAKARRFSDELPSQVQRAARIASDRVVNQ